MSEDDYESLPESSAISAHMLAGAAAGISEHCVMYPVDCVKTRMQRLMPDPRYNYRNVTDAFTKIVKYEGMRNTLRGINAVVGGAGPAHAMYFACYEKMKKVLSKGGPQNAIHHGTAGVFATVLHDLVMNPADVIKQRMQIYDSPYKTCTECAMDVYRKEGMHAFYRSYITQLSMNIPFQCIHFIIYEASQNIMNANRDYHPVTHCASGAIAGAVAAAITTPLDVCKTLLNTQEKLQVVNQGKINNLNQALRTVYSCCGPKGFFRGLSARVIYQMPSTAISWSVYEFFKHFILNRGSSGGMGSPTPSQLHAIENSTTTPSGELKDNLDKSNESDSRNVSKPPSIVNFNRDSSSVTIVSKSNI